MPLRHPPAYLFKWKAKFKIVKHNYELPTSTFREATKWFCQNKVNKNQILVSFSHWLWVTANLLYWLVATSLVPARCYWLDRIKVIWVLDANDPVVETVQANCSTELSSSMVYECEPSLWVAQSLREFSRVYESKFTRVHKSKLFTKLAPVQALSLSVKVVRSHCSLLSLLSLLISSSSSSRHSLTTSSCPDALRLIADYRRCLRSVGLIASSH